MRQDSIDRLAPLKANIKRKRQLESALLNELYVRSRLRISGGTAVNSSVSLGEKIDMVRELASIHREIKAFSSQSRSSSNDVVETDDTAPVNDALLTSVETILNSGEALNESHFVEMASMLLANKREVNPYSGSGLKPTWPNIEEPDVEALLSEFLAATNEPSVSSSQFVTTSAVDDSGFVRPDLTDVPEEAHRFASCDGLLPYINGEIQELPGSLELLRYDSDSEVAALAESLDRDPVKIYEYVTNEIDYLPYAGMSKSPRSVLASKSANSLDHAVLMASLLRYSGYPTRFVRGEITLETEQHFAWVHARSFVAAFLTMHSAGLQPDIDFTSFDSGDYSISIFVPHYWVEVCMPSSNYRGRDEDGSRESMSSGIDELEGGYTWQPLDASYKDYQHVPGVEHGLTEEEIEKKLLDDFLGSRSKDSILEMYEEEILNSAREGNPEVGLNDIGDRWIRNKSKFDHMPGSLPFSVRQFLDWEGNSGYIVDELPISYINRIELIIENNGQRLLRNTILPAFALSGRRLDIFFIEQYDDRTDSIWRNNEVVKCDIGNLQFSVLLDGRWVQDSNDAVLNSFDFQSYQPDGFSFSSQYFPACIDSDPGTTFSEPTLTANLLSPSPSFERLSFEKKLDVTKQYSMIFSFDQASQDYIEQRQEVLLDEELEHEQTGELGISEEVMGEFLHIAGLRFFQLHSEASERFQQYENSTKFRSAFEYGLTEWRPVIDYDEAGNIQAHREIAGYAIDVPLSYSLFKDNVTGLGIGGARRKVRGFHGSYLESYIWQEAAMLDAMSTTTLFQIANSTQYKRGINDFGWALGIGAEWRYSDNKLTRILDERPENHTILGIELVGFPGVDHFIPTIKASHIVDFAELANEALWEPVYGRDYNKLLTEIGNLAADSVMGGCPVISEVEDSPAHFLVAAVGPYSNCYDIDSEFVQGLRQYYESSVDEIKEFWFPYRKINVAGIGWHGNYALGINSEEYQIGGYAGGWTIDDDDDPVVYDENDGYSLDTGYEIEGSYDDESGNFDYLSSNAGTLGVSDGNSVSGDPVNLSTGNMYHFETDLTLKTRGAPINLTRFYNSLSQQSGGFGLGWIHNFEQKLQFRGNRWNRKVIWVDGSGRSHLSQVRSSTDRLNFSEVLELDPGEFFSLSRELPSINGTIITPDPSNPEHEIYQFELTEKNGTKLYFEAVPGYSGTTAKLKRIIDRNGNETRIVHDGERIDYIEDPLGRQLDFVYEGDSPLIDKIIDWGGREYNYTYDEFGRLRQYANPAVTTSTAQPNTYTYYNEADGAALKDLMKSHHAGNGSGFTFEYYSNKRVFRHTDGEGNNMSFSYNDYRRETTVFNENGEPTTYRFDANGRVVKTVEPNNGIHRYTYENGLRATHTSPIGYTARFVYDDKGNLTDEILESGNRMVKAYFNDYGEPRKVTDPRGNVSLQLFDDSGNLTDVIKFKKTFGTDINPLDLEVNPTVEVPKLSTQLASWTRHTYNDYGNVTQSIRVKDFTSPNQGQKTVFNYNDPVNNIDGVNLSTITRLGDVDGDGIIAFNEGLPVLENRFDDLGRKLVGYDINGYKQEFEYYDNDQVSKATDPNGYSRTYTYDGAGFLNTETLQTLVDGKVETIYQAATNYNLTNRISSERNELGAGKAFTYDGAGNLIKVRNSDQYEVNFDYDGMNNVIRAYDEEGSLVSTKYDLLGRVISVTNVAGVTTLYDYWDNSRDRRLKRITDPSGRFVEYDYDANGNVISMVNNTGDKTETQYDALNRPYRILGPLYNDHELGLVRPVTVNEYDALGNLIKIYAGHTSEQPLPQPDVISIQASYTYDDFGRMLSRTNQLNKTWYYTYDEFNNVKTIKDPEQKVVEYEYFYGGSIKKITTTNNGEIVYQRNPLGQVVNVSSPEVNYSYEYNLVHRLEKFTDHRANKELNYSYTLAGLLRSMTDGGNKETSFTYDPVGRLINIQAPNGDVIGYHYDEQGRLGSKLFPNGVQTNYGYYDDGKIANLSTISKNFAPSTISSYAYTYDENGNTETINSSINGDHTFKTYRYDNLGRMIDVLEGASADTLVESVRYDPFGNRYYRTDSQGTHYYLHNAAHQIREIRDGAIDGPLVKSFGYTDLGQLETKTEGSDEWEYQYNDLNQLTGVEKNNQLLESYGYDALGRRVRKTVGSTSEYFFYNGSDIYEEYLNNWNTPTAQWTYGAGVDDPILRIAGGQASYFHGDGLGSIVATTNATQLTAVQSFDSWGNKLAGGFGSIPRYGFTGREPDAATGLIYFRARYYDPALGRFLQPDPLGFVDGFNAYKYALNNPVNYIDPWGTTAIGASNTLESSTIGFFSDLADGASNAWTNGSTSDRIVMVSTAAGTLFSAVPIVGDVGAAATSLISFAAQPSWESAGNLALDAVGILPIVPALGTARRLESLSDMARACCCFVEGTPVLTQHGLIPIEKIRIGDMVYAENPETGEIALKPVTRLFLTEGKETYLLVLESEDGITQKLEVTDNHPFWVIDKGWVETLDLEIGDQTKSIEDKAFAVRELRGLGRHPDTFNFTVDGFNTYFVGVENILVHNENCSCDVTKGGGNFVQGFHGTKAKNIQSIKSDGAMKPNAQGEIYLSRNQGDTFVHGADSSIGGAVSGNVTIDVSAAKSVSNISVPGNPNTILIKTDVPLPTTVNSVKVRRPDGDGGFNYDDL